MRTGAPVDDQSSSMDARGAVAATSSERRGRDPAGESVDTSHSGLIVEVSTQFGCIGLGNPSTVCFQVLFWCRDTDAQRREFSLAVRRSV